MIDTGMIVVSGTRASGSVMRFRRIFRRDAPDVELQDLHGGEPRRNHVEETGCH